MAPGKELFGNLAVAGDAGILVDDFAIPGDAEPSEPVQDRRNRRLRRTLAVGVLDPQQHLAAATTRIKPIEQRGPRAPDVEKSGGRGRKTNDNR